MPEFLRCDHGMCGSELGDLQPDEPEPEFGLLFEE